MGALFQTTNTPNEFADKTVMSFTDEVANID